MKNAFEIYSDAEKLEEQLKPFQYFMAGCGITGFASAFLAIIWSPFVYGVFGLFLAGIIAGFLVQYENKIGRWKREAIRLYGRDEEEYW
jgi:hypothetical protein